MKDNELIRALRDKASRDNRELLDAAADRIEELSKPRKFKDDIFENAIEAEFLFGIEYDGKSYLVGTNFRCDDKDDTFYVRADAGDEYKYYKGTIRKCAEISYYDIIELLKYSIKSEVEEDGGLR